MLFKRKPNNPKIYNDDPVYLTPEGLERLKSKLKRLENSIPSLAAEAGRAAAYGDRSDNAEYKEAKRILRGTQGQIFGIKEQIKRAILIPEGPNASGTIRLGTTVILKSEAGVQKTFRIVGPKETNPSQGRISMESPIGAALLNHKQGDVVTVELPHGTQKYTILDIM